MQGSKSGECNRFGDPTIANSGRLWATRFRCIQLVLPVIDVVGEVFRDAAAYGVNVVDVVCLQLVGLYEHSLRHVAEGNHLRWECNPARGGGKATRGPSLRSG